MNPIGWCTHTINPVVGCLIGCPWCYARRQAKRQKSRCQQCYDFVPHLHAERLDQMGCGRGRRVFVGSMCDLWSAGVAPEWRVAIWERVRSAQQNAYIVLTKRPERVRGVEIGPDGEWPENLWLGTSITGEWDESGCDDRYLVHDAQSVVPADRLVVSVEPLLGHASGELSRCRPPAWLIVGPQTGPGAQPPERAWVDALVRYADDTGVPLWLKSSFARCMLDLELRQELPAAMTAICGEGR